MIDQEEVPGYHASGRNASLVLQSVAEPEVRRIVAESRAAYTSHSAEVGYSEVGSLMLGGPEALERLREPELIDSEFWTPEEVYQRIPIVKGHQFDAALFTPSDGIMDISRLLQFYLDGSRGPDVRMELNCRALEIETAGDGFEVNTTHGKVKAGLIVNAGGAWAPAIARMVGLEPLPMTSYKRHLFILDDVGDLSEGLPFVWSLSKEFYMRPESGGLLFSVCDEEAAEKDFVPTINPELDQRLVDLIWEELPGLKDATQRQVWSCFRTRTPHGGFHLGWADGLKDFLWVAGLGGHGMGASWEVGRIAAEMITSR